MDQTNEEKLDIFDILILRNVPSKTLSLNIVCVTNLKGESLKEEKNSRTLSLKEIISYFVKTITSSLMSLKGNREPKVQVLTKSSGSVQRYINTTNPFNSRLEKIQG